MHEKSNRIVKPASLESILLLCRCVYRFSRQAISIYVRTWSRSNKTWHWISLHLPVRIRCNNGCLWQFLTQTFHTWSSIAFISIHSWFDCCIFVFTILISRLVHTHSRNMRFISHFKWWNCMIGYGLKSFASITIWWLEIDPIKWNGLTRKSRRRSINLRLEKHQITWYNQNNRFICQECSWSVRLGSVDFIQIYYEQLRTFTHMRASPRDRNMR